MALYTRTVEAAQYREGETPPAGVCSCGSWDIPHVHGFDGMTSRLGTFFTGYEAVKRHLEDGDWVVRDPLTVDTLGPLVVKDADFRRHFEAVA